MSYFLEACIPIVAIVFAVGLPIGGGIFLFWKNATNKHEEKMKMIEQGLVPEEKPKKISNTTTLRNGMLMLGLGLGAILGLILGKWLEYRDEMILLIMPVSSIAFGGLALFICYFIIYNLEQKEKPDNK